MVKPILLVPITALSPRIKTYSADPKYKRFKKLTIRSRQQRIITTRIKESIEKLQKRYPKKAYYYERSKVKVILYDSKMTRAHYYPIERIFWIIGRKEEKDRGIPLYYSTTLRRLYVPLKYIKKKPKLVGSVLMYRLKDLGIRYSLRYIK